MLHNETHEASMKKILFAIFDDEIGRFLAFK